jgi:hypothetical protein
LTSTKQEQLEIDPKLSPPASLEEVDWTNYDFSTSDVQRVTRSRTANGDSAHGVASGWTIIRQK